MMVTSCLGALTDLLAAVQLNVTMTTGDVNPDDVPPRQPYGVVGSYSRCTGAAIVAACTQQLFPLSYAAIALIRQLLVLIILLVANYLLLHVIYVTVTTSCDLMVFFPSFVAFQLNYEYEEGHVTTFTPPLRIICHAYANTNRGQSVYQNEVPTAYKNTPWFRCTLYDKEWSRVTTSSPIRTVK